MKIVKRILIAAIGITGLNGLIEAFDIIIIKMAEPIRMSKQTSDALCASDAFRSKYAMA